MLKTLAQARLFWYYTNPGKKAILKGHGNRADNSVAQSQGKSQISRDLFARYVLYGCVITG